MRRASGIASFCFGVLILSSIGAPPLGAAPFAYVPNYGSNNVSVIDTASNSVVGTIGVGVGPLSIAIDGAGARVYVVNSDDQSVSVIDTATNTVATTVPVCSGIFPAVGVALSPDGGSAYIGCGFTATIHRFDTTTFVGNEAVIGESYHFAQGLAVDVVGAQVYVQLRDDFGGGARLVTVDANTLAVLGFVPMPTDIFTWITRPLGVAAAGIRVFAPNPNGNEVRVFDSQTQAVRHIALPSTSRAVAVNHTATTAYVSLGTSAVAVIDVATETLTTTFPVNGIAAGLSFSADESRLYAAIPANDSVDVIDLTSRTVVTSVPVGDNPVSVGRFIATGASPCADADGDFVCDGSDNCPDAANPSQEDDDDDAVGNVCDPCLNIDDAHTFAATPSPILTQWRSNRSLSEDEFDSVRLVADFHLPAATTLADLSLIADGARLLFVDDANRFSFDTTLPGGALGSGPGARGWRLSGDGRRWLYRDRTATPTGGIRTITLTDRSSASPGLVRIRLRGSGHVLQSDQLAHDVVIVLGDAEAGAAGMCGESAFAPNACALRNPRRWTCTNP